MSETASTSSDPKMPRCKCGHDRSHYMVSAEPQYGIWQLFVVSMGISQKPKAVEYRCRRCDQVFDRSENVSEYAQEDR